MQMLNVEISSVLLVLLCVRDARSYRVRALGHQHSSELRFDIRSPVFLIRTSGTDDCDQLQRPMSYEKRHLTRTSEFDAAYSGLSSEDAKRLEATHGLNEVQTKPMSEWKKLAKRYTDWVSIVIVRRPFPVARAYACPANNR